jgi:hypothetical protein
MPSGALQCRERTCCTSQTSYRGESYEASPRQNAVRGALRIHLGASRQVAVDEFWVPGSNTRADLVVIGDQLQAFEIKTGRDTLARLPHQAQAFSRLFDLCSLAVAERHSRRAAEMVPSWWGVILFEPTASGLEFTWLRRPKPNVQQDYRTLVRLLWREEARALLQSLGASPDPCRTRAWMWVQILERAEPECLRRAVRYALQHRDPASARIDVGRFRRGESS